MDPAHTILYHILFFLMIISDLYFILPAILPEKTNPSLVIDPDAVPSRQVPF